MACLPQLGSVPAGYAVVAGNVIVFLASPLDLGWPYIGIIRTFYRCLHNENGTSYISLKTSLWSTILSLTICVYLIVLFRSFVPKRGSSIQWSRRRKQISALKWRVVVIQGQSFYAHWKADKLLHVAV